MKTGKVIMFTSLWALGIASLFMMGSSNASFGQHAKQGNVIQSMNEVESYADLVAKVEWTRMEWKITEEKFNEMREKHAERDEKRTAVEEAIQNHDYSAWKELHEGMDILEKVNTEEKFEKLIEMKGLMEDARANMELAKEKADAIAEELWIERWMGNKMWEKRMGRWNNQGWFGMNK